MQTNPKAIVFDLDGTLLNTLADLANAVNRALLHFDFPGHEKDAYRYFVGDGAKMLIKRALPETHRDNKYIEKCLNIFKKEYEKNWNDKTRLYPGIADLLDSLGSHGIKMAILSNKPHAFTQKCVKHYLSKWEFDVVMGQQESFPAKPDPSGALYIARQMKIEPASFCYAGDSAVDMKTARAAGMFPIGVLWGFRPLEELKANGAELLVNEPSRIVQYCLNT